MSKSKRLGLTALAAALVCLAAFAALGYRDQQDAIAATGEIILEIDPDTVTALSWTYGDTTLSFQKEDGWTYAADAAFPVSADRMADLLAPFQALGAAFVIEDPDDLGQYGLTDPTCTIQITADGTEYEILVGDYSAMDAQRYVSIGDGSVYLVTTDPMEVYDTDLTTLVQNDTVPAFDTVTALRFAGAADYEAEYREENTATALADDHYFVTGSGLALDTTRVESYLATVEGLSLTDYVTYTAGSADLSAFGLDDPDLTVAVDYTDEAGKENTFTLSVARDPAQEPQEDEAPEDITAYARVGESELIYQISGYSYQSLLAASADDLRHREIFAAEAEEITALTVELEGEGYSLTAEGTGEDRVYRCGGEDFDGYDLESALTGLTASSFTDEAPEGKEEISLTLSLDNENVSAISIQLYRKDGETCLAVVDGVSVALVPRSSVVDLIEAVNAMVL